MLDLVGERGFHNASMSLLANRSGASVNVNLSLPFVMLFADHSEALRGMNPMRRSKPTRRPVRISTTRWFSKKNPAIGTRILFVPIGLSLVFGLATSTVGTSASAQSAVLSDRKHDTHGQQIRVGESIHADVDLA